MSGKIEASRKRVASMRTFLDLCRRFKRDERGAFIAIFGILAIVLIATAGAVVDYTSVEQARTRAQVALDAAALALQPSIYTQNETWLQTKAQAVLTERIADSRITATVQTVTKDVDQGEIKISATIRVPLSFVALIGITEMNANLASTATRGSKDVEVALALDITQSMAGDKIDDLIDATVDLIDQVVQDDQDPRYSKMALVPYSNAVNMGSYAASARGPVQDYTAITNAAWVTTSSTSALTISAINKASPGRITTSTNHGFQSGQTVTIYAVAGGGFTALNGNTYTITVTSTTQFTIGISTSAYSGTYTASSGRVTMGTTRVASAVTKANPAQITTTVNHGLVTGDAVYITSAAGGDFTGLNSKKYRVTKVNNTQFTLQRISGSPPTATNFSTSGYFGTYTANSAIIRKCITDECEIQITSAAHNLANDDVAYITNVSGMTQLNGQYFTVSDATTNTYTLENTDGPALSTYTSGGRSYCVTYARNCYYYWYENNDNDMVRATISNCVSERVGSEAYTDAPPESDDDPPVESWVGNVYPDTTSGFGDCPGEQFIPLTSDKTLLTNQVNAYTVEGSTAGQIGLAWAWYAISPEFAYMFPSGRGGADYDEPDLLKAVILMTDGAFNTAYCNGVISQDYGLGSFGWGDDNRNNCNANNGDPFDQAAALCTAIKKGGDGVLNTNDDVVLYTVAFDLGSEQDAIDLMADCATSADHAYAADDGDELADAFESIGNNIASLRIAN
jgi:Flp pilus assembly protein TadG